MSRVRNVVLLVVWTLVATAVADASPARDAGHANRARTAAVPSGAIGGRVTVLASGDVDFLDPGLTYYTFGYQVTYSVNRALYYFAPDAPTREIPDVAAGPPDISPDRKRLTVKLKSGVRFAPPVNREVTSADVKYAFERAFSAHVPNSYATLYFGSIVGAPKRPTSSVKDISGITTPDASTISFTFTEPVAPIVYAALVMPITIPVPREYAAPFDAKSPSTYDNHVAFTGPYMVEHDAAGMLTGWDPGRSIRAVRNPNWDPATDFRPAYLDSWTVDEGHTDGVALGSRILTGSGFVQGDGTPPAGVVRLARSRYKRQLALSPAGGTRYVALNTRRAPFNDRNVRKAVIAGFDRVALRRDRGGASAGPIAWGYLPPGFPGSRESGGARPPARLDFLQHPSGDLSLARRYMRRAGYRSGRYTGRRSILMVGTSADPGRSVAEDVARQFRRLGFHVRLRLVTQDRLYTAYCGVPTSGYAICPNVGFFKDFYDGQGLLDATFSGRQIVPSGNSNWPLLDDARVNQLIDIANAAPVGAARDRAWANVNLAVSELAPAIPYVWDVQPVLWSKDVHMAIDDYANGPFMAFLSRG